FVALFARAEREQKMQEFEPIRLAIMSIIAEHRGCISVDDAIIELMERGELEQQPPTIPTAPTVACTVEKEQAELEQDMGAWLEAEEATRNDVEMN
ncbi:MAG: hypothetical protein FD188_3537, partial [Ignavibacteria bacterium]